MAVKLTIDLDSSADLLAGYGAGAVVRVQRDTTSTFPAPTAPTLAPLANPIPIILSQEQYETWDASGTASLWYRSRYENATATVVSDWSVGFQPGQTSYASVDDVLGTFESPPTTDEKLRRISALLEEATAEFTQEIGYDFFRHPAVTGTETRYKTELDGGWRLHVHEGIVPGSIVTVKYGQYGTVLTTVTSTDYRAETDEDGAIYHLDLSGVGTTLQEFPDDRWGIAIDAAFGYVTVPPRVRGAVVDRVRQRFGADPSPTGGFVGPDEFGRPMASGRKPESWYSTAEYYKRRFAACYI